MPNGSEPNIDIQKVTLTFLHTELDTGLTFAQIALHSPFAETKRRNQANARKAYDMFLRWRKETPMSRAEAAEMQEKSSRLESALKDLGEQF